MNVPGARVSIPAPYMDPPVPDSVDLVSLRTEPPTILRPLQFDGEIERKSQAQRQLPALLLYYECYV
jgi:hypothetical protein